MPGVKDCTTCAFGVEWSGNGTPENPFRGRCRWTIPVPHPDHWVQMIAFSESSKPKTDCPAWKREKDPQKLRFRQQWQEEWTACIRRIDAERERIIAEYERKHGKMEENHV